MNRDNYEQTHKADYEAKIAQWLKTNPRYLAAVHARWQVEDPQQHLPQSSVSPLLGVEHGWRIQQAFFKPEDLLAFFESVGRLDRCQPIQFMIYDQLRNKDQGGPLVSAKFDPSLFTPYMSEATVESAARELFLKDAREQDMADADAQAAWRKP